MPKIANTSNGGTYISWFDNRTNNYQVYLQLLDFNGNKQFGENGLLVSGNPQSTSLVDYNMICDANDNSILIFSDTINNGNLNVFAYKISPTAEFLWGTNGKNRVVSAKNIYSNIKLAWTDERGSEKGIYAQNINLAGELGNSYVPVKLISFTSNVVENNIILNWSTASEVNNLGLEVLSKVGNRQLTVSSEEWEVVGFVNGNGTTTEFNNYSFVDNNILKKNYSYRLKQIDIGVPQKNFVTKLSQSV